MTAKPTRRHRTVALYEEIWQLIAEAKANGDADAYGFLTRVQAVLWQYEAITPPSPEYVPCQACRKTGRVSRWNAAVGENISVLCQWCQGSGTTWNAHPNAANRHDIRGEM